MENWERYLLPLLPGDLTRELRETGLEGAEELRIRVGRPTRILGRRNLIFRWTPDAEDCRQVLLRLCRQSLYAYSEELTACYMTLPGGFRVGLTGRMAGTQTEPHLVAPMGFNIRLAREILGCADGLMQVLWGMDGPKSALLISPPGAGKTTLLRDAARQLSERGITVCIADERRELAGCDAGVPTLDVGPCTDVLEGCKKAKALKLLLRGMAPQVLVTDELAGEEDARAVLDASGCGVRVVASAHAASLEELRRRPEIYALVEAGCFERVIALRRVAGAAPKLETVYRAEEGL
ncbi:MAG: stage III sporulation protein AA [Candidatus Pelethousia sp.]|nr:stage III sporulation protein AA [Candidatus Pelethousia sp.]